MFGKKKKDKKKKGAQKSGADSGEAGASSIPQKETTSTNVHGQQTSHVMRGGGSTDTKSFRVEVNTQSLMDEVKRLRSEKQELEAEKNKLLNREEAHTQRLAEITKLRSEKHELEAEKHKLLTRLSAALGSNISDNNAEIADLSDINRPTKLAESFSELYDNQWTDAFDVLIKSGTRDEYKVTQLLLQIVMVVYQKCRTMADKELKSLRESINTFSKVSTQTSMDIIKRMKDDRKTNYKAKLPDVQKSAASALSKILNQEIGENAEQQLDPFLKKCIELCWLMAIQDPPVHIDTAFPIESTEFNTHLFRAYTASGPYIAFVVWPVLYLNKGGPVLCKGVAQGSQSAAAKKENNDIDKSQTIETNSVSTAKCKTTTWETEINGDFKETLRKKNITEETLQKQKEDKRQTLDKTHSQLPNVSLGSSKQEQLINIQSHPISLGTSDGVAGETIGRQTKTTRNEQMGLGKEMKLTTTITVKQKPAPAPPSSITAQSQNNKQAAGSVTHQDQNARSKTQETKM